MSKTVSADTSGLQVVVVVVLSNMDVGDPLCPIHGEDAIFTHKLLQGGKLPSSSSYAIFTTGKWGTS